MKPLWNLTGRFVGWVGSSGRLYNQDGDNIGYLMDRVVYSLHGSYLGELYQEDTVGRRLNQLYPSRGVLSPLDRIQDMPLSDRSERSLPPGWDDPAF